MGELETFRTPGGLEGWSQGPGPDTILCLHGGPGMTDYTADLADEIAAGAPGWRVVRFQQRGLGPSTLEGPFTIDQAVADVVAVLDHLGAERAVVAGHSWGGHLAMYVGLHTAARVRGLLLLDPLGAIGDGGAGTMGATFLRRISAAAQARLAELESEPPSIERDTEQIGLVWPGYFADPASAPPMGPIRVDPAVNEPLFAEAFERLASSELEQGLPRVVVPCTYVIGRESPIEPANNERSAGLFPDVVVALLDTGHFPWIEQPGSMTVTTTALLARV